MRRTVMFFLACLWAWSPTPSHGQATFGAYKERTVDISVKVQGGEINLARSWDGEKGEWQYNAHEAPIQPSNDTVQAGFGGSKPKKLTRGRNTYEYGGTLPNGSAFYVRPKPMSSPGDADQIAPEYKAKLNSLGVRSCHPADRPVEERIFETEEGYRLVNESQRKWSNFATDGSLQAWGYGSRTVGEVVRSAGFVTGYKDGAGRQVLQLQRDASGQLTGATDIDGRSVSYAHATDGQLTEVSHLDGARTRYGYSGTQLTEKAYGDPDAETGSAEVRRTSLTYSGGALSSAKVLGGESGDSVGNEYEHSFDVSSGFYRRRVINPHGVVTEAYIDSAGTTRRLVVDGDTVYRLERFCEDSAVIDANNRRIFFDRDHLGRIKMIVNPDGSWVRMEHLQETWGDAAQSSATSNDPWGVKRLELSSGKTVNYERNSDGQIVQAEEELEDGSKRTWRFTYDAAGNQTSTQLVADSSEEGAEDWIQEHEFDEAGNRTLYRDELGNTWKFRWNSGQELTELTAPNGGKWLYTYTNSGKLRTVTSPGGYKTTNTYSKLGLVTKTEELYATGQTATTLYSYDKRGNVTQVVDPLGMTWSYSYDRTGNLISATDPEGNTNAFSHDSKKRLKSTTDPTGYQVQFNYYDKSGPGELPQESKPFAPQTIASFPSFKLDARRDLRGRLSQETLSAEDLSPLSTEFDYDGESRLRSVQAPDGKKTEYTYDDLSRVTSVKSPGWGVSRTEFRSNGRKMIMHDAIGGKIEYEFDRAGRPKIETRADGTTLHYQYNSMSEVVGITSSRGNHVQYVRDIEGRVVEERIYAQPPEEGSEPVRTYTFQYNLRGDLLSYSDGETTTSYELDVLGRTLKQTTNFGPFSKSHSYSYTPTGFRANYQSADGVLYRYSYLHSRLESIEFPAGEIRFEYDERSLLTRTLFPDGSKQAYEYDSFERLIRLVSTDSSSGTLFERVYSYRPDGVTIGGMQTESGEIQLQYDEGNRLTGYTSASSSESFAYDLIGNRIEQNQTSATFDPNGAIRASASTTYEYDPQGNRTKEATGAQTVNYSYDELDQLVEVDRQGEISRYGYDAIGIRIWKESEGVRTYFYFTEDGLSGEYDQNGNRIRSYLYEPGQTVQTAPLVIESGNGYFFSHNDHLGTPHRIVDTSGALRWSASYSAFGAANVSLESIENPHRLPGQYYDEETGLHYNLMRYYDPQSGAYLTQDPIGADVTGPNRYGYAYADPLNLTDPTGEYVWMGPAFAEELALQAAELAICEVLDQFASDCVKDIASEICDQTLRERGLGLGLGTIAPHLKWADRINTLRKILSKATPLVRKKLVSVVDWLRTRAMRHGLGNPFFGKTATQLDEMFRRKGFDVRGPDPKGGKGGYVNPRNQRSYHIDEANRFGETPHLDVNRLRTYSGPLDKKKYPY